MARTGVAARAELRHTHKRHTAPRRDSCATATRKNTMANGRHVSTSSSFGVYLQSPYRYSWLRSVNRHVRLALRSSLRVRAHAAFDRRPIGTQMPWNCQRNRIGSTGPGDRACRLGGTDSRREFGMPRRVAARNLLKRVPDMLLEYSALQVQRQIKANRWRFHEAHDTCDMSLELCLLPDPSRRAQIDPGCARTSAPGSPSIVIAPMPRAVPATRIEPKVEVAPRFSAYPDQMTQ